MKKYILFVCAFFGISFSGCNAWNAWLHDLADDWDQDSYIDCAQAEPGQACDTNDDDPNIHPGPDSCNGIDNDGDGLKDEDGWVLQYPDSDGDGYGDASATPLEQCDLQPGYALIVTEEDKDCDDDRFDIHPDANELCDEADNNCNNEVDENLLTFQWYIDNDQDGYGGETIVESCNPPPDQSFVSAQPGDCNDENSDIHPQMDEQCNGIDDDCDGVSDEDLPLLSAWLDADGDGYGDPAQPQSALPPPSIQCAVMPGYVENDVDCNDTRSDVHPGAMEFCGGDDLNCDDNSPQQPEDLDEDGYWSCSSSADAPTDCDDARATTFPGARELCNGRDDDCDGIEDNVGLQVWFLDLDEDGYGDPESACQTLAGVVENVGTYTDQDGETYPLPDCPSLLLLDGTAGTATTQCDWEQHSLQGEDCDDGHSTVSPARAELCNGLDDDCDGSVDNVESDTTWYKDFDKDGYGSQDPTDWVTTFCPPKGYVSNRNDCDDKDDDIHPNAIEKIGNGVDEDCDGHELCYQDRDGDGYADQAQLLSTTDLDCSVPPAVQTVEGAPPTKLESCDDDSTRNPDVTELCNGIDDDCNEVTDDIQLTFYTDLDGDGYGAKDGNSTTLTECPGYGFSTSFDDCDDEVESIHPDQKDLCNGIDDDCDEDIDEDGTSTWYLDRDGDNFGDTAASSVSCDAPTGYVSSPGDCNDTNASIHPAATEVCDAIDNNCNNATDEESDQDEDGFTSCASPTPDCNDSAFDIHPGADELCDGVDNNCNDSIDESSATDAKTWYQDADGDGYGYGYGDPSNTTLACEQPAGYVTDDSDCDDLLDTVNPEADEIPDDGLDNDCDGTPDWDLRVCPGNDDLTDYASIQDALDDAAGDPALDALLIAVCPGTYAELLTLPARPLRLLGTHGPELTTVTPPAQTDGSTVRFAAGAEETTLLEGFTLEAGTGSLGTDTDKNGCGHSATDRHGGSVCIQDSSPTLKHLIITPSQAQAQAPVYGGGIYLRQTAGQTAATRLEQVTLQGNTATSQGGGLYALYAVLDLEHVQVSGNNATSSSGKGGGLALFSATTTARWLRMDHNTASSVGGGLFLSRGSFTAEQLHMNANDATTSGGAIQVQDGITSEPSTLTVTHALLEANRSTKGGGIYVDGFATLRLTHGVARGHSQSVSGGKLGSGGGLYITGSNVSATLEQCVITGNEATSATAGQGGGIYFNNSGHPLVLTRTVLAYNLDSTAGSNLFVAGGSAVSSTAGCFYLTSGASGVQGATLSSNLCSSARPGWLNAPDQGGFLDDDYHLALGSPLIEAGGTSAFDPDGSDLDVGLYGGPFANTRDLDWDSIPEWFWTEAFSLPPDGVEAAAYECFDLDAERSGCAAERGSGGYDQPE